VPVFRWTKSTIREPLTKRQLLTAHSRNPKEHSEHCLVDLKLTPSATTLRRLSDEKQFFPLDDIDSKILFDSRIYDYIRFLHPWRPSSPTPNNIPRRPIQDVWIINGIKIVRMRFKKRVKRVDGDLLSLTRTR
jgi:hypothetical protein